MEPIGRMPSRVSAGQHAGMHPGPATAGGSEVGLPRSEFKGGAPRQLAHVSRSSFSRNETGEAVQREPCTTCGLPSASLPEVHGPAASRRPGRS